MARKTAKSTKKPAKRWTARMVKDKIVAAHGEGEHVQKIVDEAIIRMAGDVNQKSLQVWFDGPQGPGLHLMRTERGENYDYTVVRAVFINDGLSQCYEMRWTGGVKMDMAEYTNPNFQKVSE